MRLLSRYFTSPAAFLSLGAAAESSNPGVFDVPFQDTYHFDKHQEVVRYDWNINAKTNFFFRWVDDSQRESQQFGIFSGNSFPALPQYRKKPGASWRALPTSGRTLPGTKTTNNGWRTRSWNSASPWKITRYRTAVCVPVWWERRNRLESILRTAASPIHLTPATADFNVAGDWFHRFEGAGLDGVIAKPVSGFYESNKRVMLKIKHERDCDCVVEGFRWHKKGDRTLVGSLLLGLYDGAGALQHVGVCASFRTAKRKELVEFLDPYRQNALDAHPWKSWAEYAEEGIKRMPGGQSRWSQGKDLSWEPLRPELVVEVAYDHMQGNRFRHTAQFRRWRPEKKPADCTYEQLEVVPPQESLKSAYQRACKVARIQEAIDALVETELDGESPSMPRSLASRIARLIKDTSKSWDEALSEIVYEMRVKQR